MANAHALRTQHVINTQADDIIYTHRLTRGRDSGRDEYEKEEFPRRLWKFPQIYIQDKRNWTVEFPLLIDDTEFVRPGNYRS